MGNVEISNPEQINNQRGSLSVMTVLYFECCASYTFVYFRTVQGVSIAFQHDE